MVFYSFETLYYYWTKCGFDYFFVLCKKFIACGAATSLCILYGGSMGSRERALKIVINKPTYTHNTQLVSCAYCEIYILYVSHPHPLYSPHHQCHLNVLFEMWSCRNFLAAIHYIYRLEVVIAAAHISYLDKPFSIIPACIILHGLSKYEMCAQLATIYSCVYNTINAINVFLLLLLSKYRLAPRFEWSSLVQRFNNKSTIYI